MSNTNLHIDRAHLLYRNLLSYRTDFICKGVEHYFSAQFNNQVAYTIFFYLFDGLSKGKDKFVTEKSIKIQLHKRYQNIQFETEHKGVVIQCRDSLLTLVPKNVEEEFTVTNMKLEGLRDFIKEAVECSATIDSLPLSSSKEEERNEKTLRSLYEHVEKEQEEKIFQKWYSDGIENISYKIFNEFVLSFTGAEYLRSSAFTAKLKKFKDDISNYKWGSEDNEIIPQLIHTINVMVMHYQLFCRHVESQILRKPNELYFCSQRDIENELKSTLPILGLGKFKKDNSNIIAELFAAIIDIGYIDHRFVLEQPTIERLIFALEKIKYLGENHLGIESWTLVQADIENLENLENNAHVRKNTTKIILKLVYAKACTLLGKIDFFIQTLLSPSPIPRPSFKIIDLEKIRTCWELAQAYGERKTTDKLFFQFNVFAIGNPAIGIPADYLLPDRFGAPADKPEAAWNPVDYLYKSIAAFDQPGKLPIVDTTG